MKCRLSLFYKIKVMKHITYIPTGTCSKKIDVEINDEGLINNVCFTGGCNGNLKGIGSLVRGMSPKDVIKRLDGIKCGGKNTSCPEQLCRALEKFSES